MTRFYLSTDDELDAGDILLGSRAVPALTFGAASLGQHRRDLATGICRHRLLHHRQGRRDQLRGRSARGQQHPDPPDQHRRRFHRHRRSPRRPSPAPDSQITVAAATKNQGAAAGPSSTHFYLSSDDDLERRGIASSGAPPCRPWPRTSPRRCRSTVTLPGQAPEPATYFIIAKANGDGAATEVDPTNNTKARAIILGPDLVVPALTVQATGGAGLPFDHHRHHPERRGRRRAARRSRTTTCRPTPPSTARTCSSEVDRRAGAGAGSVGRGLRHRDDPRRHAGRHLRRHCRGRRDEQRSRRSTRGTITAVQADQDRSRPRDLDPGGTRSPPRRGARSP